MKRLLLWLLSFKSGRAMLKGATPLVLINILLLSLHDIRAQTDVGMDLSDGLDGLYLVDIAKTSRFFRQLGPFNSPDASVDVNGWPTEDFQMLIADLRNPFGNPSTFGEPRPGDDPDPPKLNIDGVYKGVFNGKAQLIGLIVCGSCEITNVVYNAGTNTTTFDWNYVSQTEGRPYFALRFEGTQRSSNAALGSGITNLRIYRPGYDPIAEPNRIFTDEWLGFIEPFTPLRYMNWSGQNTLGKFSDQDRRIGPLEVDWANREVMKPDDAIRGQIKTFSFFPSDGSGPRPVLKPRGLPWEYIMEHITLTGKDAWINIPVHASDEYITQLARLVKNSIPSDINLYLEYSNEVWNFSFNAFQWNFQKAKQEVAAGSTDLTYDDGILGNADDTNDNLWAARRYARRTLEIGQIFQAEGVGTIGQRIKPVLCWFSSAPGILAAGGNVNSLEAMLKYIADNFGPPKNFISAISTTGYFGNAEVKELPETASVQEMLEAIDKGVPAYFGTVGDIADRYDLEFTIYEGASGWDSTGRPEDRLKLPNRIRAERSERMGQLIQKNILDGFKFNNGGTYVYFASHKFYDRSGFWATTDLITDQFANPNDVSRGYKYKALLDLIDGVPINREPIVAADSLNIGFVNRPYEDEIDVWGGNAPITLEISGSDLPPGLSIEGNRIVGTPTVAGSYLVDITATDADGDIATRTANLVVTAVEDITAAAIPIEIDGSGDDTAWADTPFRTLNNVIRGPFGFTPSDFSARFKTKWDVQNIYFYIEVTDESLISDSDQRFADDGTEIYLDIGNDKLISYGPDDVQLIFRYGDPVTQVLPTTSGALANFIQRAEQETADGYTLEVSIPWGAFGVNPMEGDLLGFEVHATDDDDGGDRDNKISYNSSQDNATSNPQAFATGQLIGEGGQLPDPVQLDIPRIAAAPVIDGIVDEVWSAVPNNAINNLVRGDSQPSSADFSGRYKVAWDDDKLYFSLLVNDDQIVSDSGSSLFNDDSFEIFLDVGNDRSFTYGANDYQIAFRFNDPDFLVLPGARQLEGIEVADRTISGGYRAEIAIPWSSLGETPADGVKIGVEVHIADDDDGGDRDSKLAFAGLADNAFQNPSSFAEGTLSGTGSIDNEYFLIKNKQLQLYMYPLGSGNSDNLNVAEDDGSDLFLWRKVTATGGFFFLENKATGKRIRPLSDQDLSPVRQRAASNTGSFYQWSEALSADGEYVHLINRASDKFIRPRGRNNTRIELRPNTLTGPWTRWMFVSESDRPAIPAASLFLQHVHDGRYAQDTGTSITSLPLDGSDGFQWEKIDKGNGFFALKNATSGLYARAAGTAQGDLLTLSANDSGDLALWEEVPNTEIGDGAVFLQNKASGRRLAPINGSDRRLALGGTGWQGTWVTWQFLESPASTTLKAIIGQGGNEVGTAVYLYPNPSSGTLYVRGIPKGERTYQVYDLSGKVLVLKGDFDGDTNGKIDVSGLPNGVYILRTPTASLSFVKN